MFKVLGLLVVGITGLLTLVDGVAAHDWTLILIGIGLLLLFLAGHIILRLKE